MRRATHDSLDVAVFFWIKQLARAIGIYYQWGLDYSKSRQFDEEAEHP